jgi:hypothetical protein
MSLNDLAARVETVRKQRGDTPPEQATLRQQIVRIEGGGSAGPMWRGDLAEALGLDPAELFGLTVETSLPRPLLLQLPVDRDVLTVIADQRAVHIRAEHTFGPEYAQPLVERDLQTVEALIKSTPAELRTQVREVAGTIAEVAGKTSGITPKRGNSPIEPRITCEPPPLNCAPWCGCANPTSSPARTPTWRSNLPPMPHE